MDILNITEHIRILEELLLHQDFSNSPERLESMFSENFREINPDGVIVPRNAVVNWILNKDQAARWQFNDFEVKKLSQGLVQATYHAKQIAPVEKARQVAKPSKGAVHSSLWQEINAGKSWQLLFHQSTRVK